MAVRLQRKLDSVKFDTVHFDTIGLAQYRSLVSGAGTVLNHHNVESSMMEHRAANETRRIPQLYWRWEAQKLLRAERNYCPRFSVNLAVSPEDGEALASLAPGIKTKVVANGVDTEYFTPRPDPGGNTILFCGGLDWYPNGEAMAYFFDQTWPLLVSRVPDVRALIVGRNPPKWLTQLAVSDQRVEVTGFVDDVRPYFEKATVYICPIRVGGGTRLKILDALAMGMPMVSTTFACSGISVQHEKNVLLADTPEAFAEHVQRLLANPAQRADLASQARDLACKNYSWSVIGKSLVEAYREAASAAAQKSKPLYP
jgi:glycosyltransferase involved in cell wall biosynthesis